MLYGLLALFLAVVPTTVAEPQTSRPGFPTAISLAVVSDQLRLSDPFGQGGASDFSSSASGLAFKMDVSIFHLDATGQMLGSSLEHRRIKIVFNGPFLRQPGKGQIGLELAYRELGYRRRSSVIGEVSLYTVRQSREYDYGIALRKSVHGGTFRWSVTLGYIENRYDSIVSVSQFTGSRLMVGDGTPIVAIGASFETGQFWGRLRMSGGTRYVRTFRDQSSWTPRNELSGQATLDVRVFGGSGSSFALGIAGHLGPREHALTSDNAVGLRAIWKIK